MAEKRFKIYDKETWDTYIEDTQDIYSDGTPKTYWFNENEDFCKLFDKLNEIADENMQLKSKLFDCQLELEHSKESVDDAYWELTEIKKENEQLKSRIKDYDVALKKLQDLTDKKLKENEQLKSEYEVLRTQYQDLKKLVENNLDEHLTQEKLNRQIIKLSDENEQLKQRINELKKVEKLAFNKGLIGYKR